MAVQRVETAANVWEERLVFSGYYTFGVGDRDGLIVRLDSLGNFDASLAGGGGWISGDGNDDIFNTLAVEDNSLASATDGRITLGGFIDNGVWVAPDWVADRDILLAGLTLTARWIPVLMVTQARRTVGLLTHLIAVEMALTMKLLPN